MHVFSLINLSEPVVHKKTEVQRKTELEAEIKVSMVSVYMDSMHLHGNKSWFGAHSHFRKGCSCMKQDSTVDCNLYGVDSKTELLILKFPFNGVHVNLLKFALFKICMMNIY